jgi:hypothetical protein
VPEPQACPNDAELQTLLDGAAPDERQAVFATHLDSCDACRRRLDSLAGHSNVVPPEVAAGGASPNGHTYEVVVKPEGISWPEANAQADHMGGHLVTITSEAEEDFVRRLIDDPQYWILAPQTGFMRGPWIGAWQRVEAREPDGGWRWVTGEPFIYSDWKDGEPNDIGPPYRQQRVFYHLEGADRQKAQWGDASSDATTRSFVVEFEPPVPTSPEPGTDPYASLILRPGTPQRIDLVLRDSDVEIGRMFSSGRRTVFVPSGTYSWELQERYDQNRLLARGTFELAPGDRVEVSPDGTIVQSCSNGLIKSTPP